MSLPCSVFAPLVENPSNPWGIVARGPCHKPAVLLDAYYHGAFPWFSDQGQFWFSPPQRCTLTPSDFHITKSFSKTLRNTKYEVRVLSTPHEVGRVLHQCASTPRPGPPPGTWLTPELQRHLCSMAGAVVVALEVSSPNGAVLGGLYGLRIGAMFCGESMFSLAPNGSKIALAALCHQAQNLGIELIDCQQETHHLLALGAQPLPRASYLRHLARLRPPQITGLLQQPQWPDTLPPPLLQRTP